MKKDDRLYAIHINECIEKVALYTQNGRDAFVESTLIQDAVIRNLQTLAESAKRISESTKARYPEVEWARIIGFRNVLVHDYLGVDIEKIWDVVVIELPKLKEQALRLLAESR